MSPDQDSSPDGQRRGAGAALLSSQVGRKSIPQWETLSVSRSVLGIGVGAERRGGGGGVGGGGGGGGGGTESHRVP